MRFWANIRRLTHILSVLVRHLLAHATGKCLTRWPWLARRMLRGTLSKPERLRVAFEEAGGTFIKFGQMLALQTDILPLEYRNALFDLLDRITPFGFEQVSEKFVDEFGKEPKD